MSRKPENVSSDASRDAPDKKGKSSLVSRLAGSTALLAATVVFLAVIFFQTIHGDFLKGAFKTPLAEWSTIMAEGIGSDPSIAQRAATRHRIGVIVTFEQETFAFGLEGQPIDPQILLDHASQFRRIDVAGHGGNQYSFFLDREHATTTYWPLLLTMIALLLLTIGIVYAVQLSQLRPLRWLRDGVESVSGGDFATRVPVVRLDEIGQVARAFNRMTQRINEMMNDRERLLADVSHELRSPMARIKVALELLPEGAKRDAIGQDIREMETLTSALLERERVRDLTESSDLEPVDLVGITKKVIEAFDGHAPAIVLADSPVTLVIQADAALMKVLVQNLLDNALKFSLPDSKPVEIRLGDNGDQVELVVEDDGPGIPADQTERVFEPFVKLDPARGHRSGYGLGLNLCHRIVQAQGGTIQISPRDGRGTRVCVRFPDV